MNGLQRLSVYPGLTAVRLWREVRERGFEGGYTAVKRAVQGLCPNPVQPSEVRLETQPGAQEQGNFARFEVAFTDEPGSTQIVRHGASRVGLRGPPPCEGKDHG